MKGKGISEGKKKKGVLRMGFKKGLKEGRVGWRGEGNKTKESRKREQ